MKSTRESLDLLAVDKIIYRLLITASDNDPKFDALPEDGVTIFGRGDWIRAKSRRKPRDA